MMFLKTRPSAYIFQLLEVSFSFSPLPQQILYPISVSEIPVAPDNYVRFGFMVDDYVRFRLSFDADGQRIRRARALALLQHLHLRDVPHQAALSPSPLHCSARFHAGRTLPSHQHVPTRRCESAEFAPR